jgi:hypothetical protein
MAGVRDVGACPLGFLEYAVPKVLVGASMKVIQADPLNKSHMRDVCWGAVQFARDVGRPDILPDIETIEGRLNLDAAIDALMKTGFVSIFLAYDGDKCVGGTGVMIAPYPFDATRKSADELFWWAARDAPARAGMALLYRMRRHIKECGASFAVMHHLPESPGAVPKIYQRMGLKLLQHTYAGAV